MRIGRRQGFAWSSIVTGENPHGPGATFPGQTQAEFRVADAAREHHVDWAGEVVAVLEEERTLFWEKHFEALVDGDLRLVGFDLAEIRIDGGVEHEAVVQDELGIET